MRQHPEITAQLLNIHYDKPADAFSGVLNGYPLFLKWFRIEQVYSVRIYAKHPQAESCREQLESFRQMHPGYHFLNLRAGVLSASYILQNGESEAQLANEISALAALAAQLGLIPCCTDCGAESQQLEIYRISLTEGMCLCPACSEYCRQKTQRANTALKAHRPSGGGTVLGILAMAVYLFIMLYLLGSGQMARGVSAALHVAVASLIGMALTRIYGGMITRKTAVLSVIVCTVCSAGFILLRQAVDMTKFNQKNLAQFQCIARYYEVVDRGEDPFAVFADDKDMLEIAAGYVDYTPEKTAESRNRTAFVCQYHTFGSVLLHFREGMRKVYNTRARHDFWFSFFLAAGTAVWIGICWWRPLLRRQQEYFQFTAMPASGRLAQTISNQT